MAGKTPPGGPGRFSKRVDRPTVPPLAGSDLEFGDVQRLQEARQTVPPLGSKGAPAKIPLATGSRPSGMGGGGGGLPSFLFDTESGSSELPDTTGLSTGPGPGPEILQNQEPPQDFRELVLQTMASMYDNQEAYLMLSELRRERQATVEAQATTPVAPAMEDGAPTEPSDELAISAAPLGLPPEEEPTSDLTSEDQASLASEPGVAPVGQEGTPAI